MSVGWIALQNRAIRQVTDAYFALLTDAEEAKVREIAAATTIQCAYRGHLARKYLGLLNAEATTIQRVFRGYRDRKLCSQQRLATAQDVELAYYSYMATQIQKVVRGHLSRKYKENFYARKAFVNQVSTRAEQLRQEMNAALTAQLERAAADKAAADAKEFATLTFKQHHMKSTQAQPGPYAPRIGPNGPIQPKTANGIPLDVHFDTAFSNHFRTLYPQQLALKQLQLTHQHTNAPASTATHTANFKQPLQARRTRGAATAAKAGSGEPGALTLPSADSEQKESDSTGGLKLQLPAANARALPLPRSKISPVSLLSPAAAARFASTAEQNFAPSGAVTTASVASAQPQSSSNGPVGSQRAHVNERKQRLRGGVANIYGSSLTGVGFGSSPFVTSSSGVGASQGANAAQTLQRPGSARTAAQSQTLVLPQLQPQLAQCG